MGPLAKIHLIYLYRVSLVAQMVKNPPANTEDLGSIPESGRFSGEGNGNPLQYSCLENSMDRGNGQSMESQRVGHQWATNTIYGNRIQDLDVSPSTSSLYPLLHCQLFRAGLISSEHASFSTSSFPILPKLCFPSRTTFHHITLKDFHYHLRR